MQSVRFMNRGIELAGNLHLPPGFDPSRTYAALVCVHPGSSVKEQTAGLYAARMAALGFVALVFDASYQGESGGEPRFLEDPATRVEDVRCAVDFLVTLAYVDEHRIGVLGVCAGGGYAVAAAMTERRIKAVGTVVAARSGRQGAGATLDAVAEARTRAARGEPVRVVNWIPNTPAELAASGKDELDLREAVDYYRTPRGQHPRSTNQLVFRSFAAMLGFDPLDHVEDLLTQPLQVVIGDRVGAFGSYATGQELFRRATCPKDLLVVAGASHYDLYDQPAYVDQAVAKLGAFFSTHLPV